MPVKTRIVIAADVHLGLRGRQDDGKVFGDVAAVFDRALPAISSTKPDAAVFLGDLVNRGYDSEYAHFRTAMPTTFPKIIPVLGNHELQRASIADFERHMRTKAFRTESIGGLPAIVLNSGVENLPDSQWHGTLSADQINFLDTELPRVKSGPLLVFVHHPIAGTTRDSERPMFGLTNGDELQSRLAGRGWPTIVFSAHTHNASFVSHGQISYLNAPAMGFWPHSFLVVEVAKDGIEFTTQRVLNDPDDSPDADAHDRAYRAAREGAHGDQRGKIPL